MPPKQDKFAVKNATANPQQITAEQILREAVERMGDERPGPSRKIASKEELADYKVNKRKEFEDTLRKQRHHMGTWIKYAQWEESQEEFRRARSVFERALQIDYRNSSLWLKYIEMEMKHKFVAHARNLFDRVTSLLPRHDQFWYKYAYMEELLMDYAAARKVYERWMQWQPSDNAWLQYIKFELRCHEIERARAIYERYVSQIQTVMSFTRLAKFEERHGNNVRARAGYQTCHDTLKDDLSPEGITEDLYIKWAEFEQRAARDDPSAAAKVYKLGIDTLPPERTANLRDKYAKYMKQKGTRTDIERLLLEKCRLKYEKQLSDSDGVDVDIWINYILLEESIGDSAAQCREVYERAIAAALPPEQAAPKGRKDLYRRYVYIWLFYANYEESLIQSGESTPDRVREVYHTALSLFRSRKIYFSKLYNAYAEFEIRQMDVARARLVYGRAIGESKKASMFRSYIQFEFNLGQVDRARRICASYVSAHSLEAASWVCWMDLEMKLSEVNRARKLGEMAIKLADESASDESEEVMNEPELIWKKCIDIEIDQEEMENARDLFERLLDRTTHVKVWRSYADFELKHADQSFSKAKEVLERGIAEAKKDEDPESRRLLLEYMLKLAKEAKYDDIANIESRQPKAVKHKGRVDQSHGGGEAGAEDTVMVTVWEFPDDEVAGDAAKKPKIKLLEAAKMFKKMRLSEQASSSHL
ncbi:NineTeen Complex (NTC) component [Perkinsus olseni]|uniref:NineTeen Complex (NTC) component n=1 Tax=Perkinsus olseni TaxID=32597 RepID=A0A7J6MPL0_PEROL|nr:NineTeen Complex (NTC) component [Perkinsus olseni]